MPILIWPLRGGGEEHQPKWPPTPTRWNTYVRLLHLLPSQESCLMSTILQKQKEENNRIKNMDFKLNNIEIIFRGGETAQYYT